MFYLREKCLTQEKLFESQEESLGNRVDASLHANKNGKSEEVYIQKTLELLEDSHKGLVTYSNTFDYDFKTNKKVDFFNFVFNIIIIVLMVL